MEILPHMKPGWYRLKTSNELYTGIWKVTARFNVQIRIGVFVACVRLRHEIGPVKHFTVDELNRLFRPLEAS